MFPNLTTPNDGQTALPAGLVGGEPGAPIIPGMGAQPAPLPDMPDASQPAGAPGMPSVPGMGVAGAPAPPPPTQMELLAQEIAKSRAEIAARRQQHEQFLQQMMTTDGLSQYLPKPSAKQMLSDALTNFGMARLTKGNFEPIQARRFDEAFKRHGAAVQNAQLALSADKQDELSVANMENQSLRYQQLAEKEANDQAKQQSVTLERQRKEAASKAMLDFKDKVLKLSTLPANASKEEVNAAKAEFDRAQAAALRFGGGDMYHTAGATMQAMEEAGQLPADPQERFKVQEDFLKRLKDATTRFNPNAGMIASFATDANNDKYLQTARKDGSSIKVIPVSVQGTDGKDVSWAKIPQPVQKSVTQIRAARDVAGELKNLLETTMVQGADGKQRPLKDVGSASIADALGAGVATRGHYLAYIKGIGNSSDPVGSMGLAEKVATDGARTGGAGENQEAAAKLDKIIQLAALVKIMGGAPFLSGVRAFPYIKQIQTHLVNEEADTPSQMYHKLSTIEPRWDSTEKILIDEALHPVSAGSNAKTPPRATPATPAKRPPLSSFEGGR